MVARGHEEGHGSERPLPLFRLAGLDPVERAVVTSGWDVNSVAHRFGPGRGELVVGVDRLATAHERRGAPRVPISERLARKSVATVLAAQVPELGDDLYAVAAELAGASEEWRGCRMEIDGDPFDASEREFEERWIRYCLTPELIVFVTGPTALRPDTVALEELAPDELEGALGPR